MGVILCCGYTEKYKVAMKICVSVQVSVHQCIECKIVISL